MAGRGLTDAVRVAIVGFLSLLLAAQAVRTAAVADRHRHPTVAEALWPSHPAVLTDKVLLEIASAAARSQPLPGRVQWELRRIAVRAPISPDSFLIAGAIAETQHKSAMAERLLLAARDRDPRSRGTRYLLADRYLRTGRVPEALSEIRVLVGLQGRGGEPFVPMLVSYARTPGAGAQLKPFFRNYPEIESAVLSSLATDARNADLILALAEPGKTVPVWLELMTSALVADGQYAKAYSIWTKLSGVRASPGGLFNPTFAVSKAPPPFNWRYPQTADGVAQPDGKGGLDILYYGRAKAPLASQLSVLKPGSYRFFHGLADPTGDPGSIHWVVRCAKPDQILADVPLGAGRIAFQFAVPSGCEALWFELQGVPGDSPQTTGLTVRGLHLEGIAR